MVSILEGTGAPKPQRPPRVRFAPAVIPTDAVITMSWRDACPAPKTLAGLALGAGALAAAAYLLPKAQPYLRQILTDGWASDDAGIDLSDEAAEQLDALINEAPDLSASSSPPSGVDAAPSEARDMESDVETIDGIGPTYARLLHAAGITSTNELRGFTADALRERLAATNEDAAIVQRVPSAARVQNWLDQVS